LSCNLIKKHGCTGLKRTDNSTCKSACKAKKHIDELVKEESMLFDPELSGSAGLSVVVGTEENLNKWRSELGLKPMGCRSNEIKTIREQAIDYIEQQKQPVTEGNIDLISRSIEAGLLCVNHAESQ